jgi:hypothetical protein
VKLSSPAVSWMPKTSKNQFTLPVQCLRNIARESDGSVVVITQWPQQCHALGKQVQGLFDCVEPIESGDLLDHCERIDECRGNAQVLALLDFFDLCFSGISGELKSIRTAFEQGKRSNLRLTKNRAVFEHLLVLADTPSPPTLERAVAAIASIEGIRLFRRELFEALKQSVREYASGEHQSLADAAFHTRSVTSRVGRKPRRLVIARTVLVKGLEFNHAVLLNPAALDRNNLYVAVTRPTMSLTVVSETQQWTPSPPPLG